MSFPFHQIYSLDDYNNVLQPAVFFGMYRYEDFMLLDNHAANAITFFTGQDVLQWDADRLRHIHQWSNTRTAHPKVFQYLKEKGHYCQLVKPSSFLNEINPTKLGSSIYAYCPSSAPDYHGKKILDELKERGYEIIIGDGSITDWANRSDEFYSKCFIGLCLSEFAGGGTSIIEMGLRGMRVVTNVFNLPNTISWNTIDDVVKAIDNETVMIGSTNRGLAKAVFSELDHDYKWLEI